MLSVLRGTLLNGAISDINPPTTSAAFLPYVHCLFAKTYAAAAATVTYPSFTLDFLQNSCGLSPEAAAAAANKLQLKNTERADAVLALLRDYGFSRPQIAALVSRRPAFLLSNPGRTLKPKLDFYRLEVGLSDVNLPKILSTKPWLLLLSVKKRLAPNLEFLRSLYGGDEKLLGIVRKWTHMLIEDLPSLLLPRIDMLRSYGATDAVILRLFTFHPKSFMEQQPRFADAFERIKRIPIRPSASTFAHALGVLGVLSQRTWERKLTNFRRLGWSEEQVFHAFARHPYCILASVDKVRGNMEFFVDKLAWKPDYVSMNPVVLSLSLEKRILPRCSVLAILASKGLFDGKVKAMHLLIGEHKFLEKYVTKYQDELPELLKAMKANKIDRVEGFEHQVRKLC